MPIGIKGSSRLHTRTFSQCFPNALYTSIMPFLDYAQTYEPYDAVVTVYAMRRQDTTRSCRRFVSFTIFLLSHCPHERRHETLYDELLAGKPVLCPRTASNLSPIAGTTVRGIEPSTEGTLIMSVGRHPQISFGRLRRLRGSRAYRTYVRMTVSAH